MRTATAFVVLALLVVAVGCASKEPAAPTTPPVAEGPIVDTFDDGLADTTADEDLGDLESLDADLAAFE